MKASKKQSRPQARGRSLHPVVGHLPDGFDPQAALYRARLSCKIARDGLEGKSNPAHWSCTPTEYAMFNLLHAVEDIASAIAYSNQPNNYSASGVGERKE